MDTVRACRNFGPFGRAHGDCGVVLKAFGLSSRPEKATCENIWSTIVDSYTSSVKIYGAL